MDEVDAETKAKADRAAAIYGQIADLLKKEGSHVVGAVLGSLLAAYLSAHDLIDQVDTLDQVVALASKILRDLNAANGIHDMGNVQFQFTYEDGIREEMEKDPKMAEFVRESTSRVRQALSDLQAGKYESIDEAMQAIGLGQVDPDDLEELKDRLAAPRGKPS